MPQEAFLEPVTGQLISKEAEEQKVKTSREGVWELRAAEREMK